MRCGWWLAAAGALALGALVGCAEAEGSTEVVVVVDATTPLAERVAHLAATVVASDGVVVGEADFALGPDTALPLAALRLVPRGDDASRGWQATLEARDGEGRVLGRQTVEGGYVAGESREVWVVFDAACEEVACPDPFRCQEGRCVERCVEGTPARGVRRSRPVACEAPCDGPRCLGEVIAACEAGALVLDRACRLGCADASACQEVRASNVDRVVGAPDARLRDLRVPRDVWASFGDGGSIRSDEGTLLRGAGDFVDGIGFELLSVGATVYAVVTVRDLVIEPGAVLALADAHPTIFLVHGEARIDGRLQASDRAGAGAGTVGDGEGPGAGAAGLRGEVGFGGGAGGSHASSGGRGGSGGAGAPGGLAGPTYGAPELVPLLPGSSGGGGAGGAAGGGGGGAVQITARDRIVVGPEGDVSARGFRGETRGGAAGGGGGAGGAILLEAPEVVLVEGSGRRLDASGADGGEGRDASNRAIERGDGSASTFDAEDGLDGRAASGGGGGAGRVVIRNAGGDGREAYEDEVLPTGAGVFGVGPVGRAPPP